MSKSSQWRTAWLREARIGRRLERLAVRLELPEAECRPTWDPPTLDIVEIGADLPWFAMHVRLVATRLGTADSVAAENWIGHGERAPDLVARWKIDEDVGQSRIWDKRTVVEVTVRCLSPIGCKIDPRTAYVPEKRVAIHPECAALLRELEDVG